MATAPLDIGEEKDDLLTCSICLQIFKHPKYLPCLHTFCKLCIHTYIQSSTVKENNNKGFRCPVCRTFVSIGGNPDIWAEELPNNHLIISMIDRQAIQKLEKLCNACELSNVQQKAVSWCSVCQEALCSVCENCHRKFKMSSKHKILTLQEVQEGQKTAVSGLVTCDTHSDKYVEIFCVDHSKPCCTVCATVKHRKCETVVVIEEAAVGMRESEKMAEFIELVMQWENMLEKSMQDTEENVASVALLENNIFSEIEKLRREIIENVNKLENATKEELTTKKKVIITELTDRLSEITSLKSTVNNWHKILSTCKTDGSDIQCLIEFNKLIPMKEKIESEIEKVTSAFDERSFLFERNRLVGDFQETVKSLGEIRVVNQQQTVKLESISDSTIDAITKTDNEKVKSQSEISMFNLRQRHLNKPPNSSTDYLVRRLRSGNSSYR